MAGENATFTLDFGPEASGLPAFTVFRNPGGTDYVQTGEAPTLTALTSGFIDFQWSGVQVHFRAELTQGANTTYVAGEINQLNRLPLGDGSIYVDHDYGSTDALRILNDDPPYDPIDNAFIYFFLKEDWDASRRNKDRHLQAWTTTKNDGRFLQGVYLDPNTYTILVIKARAIPQTQELVVSPLDLGV